MSNVYAITGATGLLGSNLANFLINSGQTVFALVKDEQSRSILSREANRVFGDINSKQDIEYFIQKSNPDFFVHLAAQTQAYDSLKYPYQTFYNNCVGTLNVLECLREYGNARGIIVASSDKAYGELIGDTYTENHPLKGIYPYDASKSATDLISTSYRKTYDMPIVITRACNIYGIGDYNKQRLIPGIINSHMTMKSFTIRNSGQDLREYIYVNDVVSAYIKIMQYAEGSGSESVFNISSGDRYTTLEVFNLVADIIGVAIPRKIMESQGFEIKRQFMDSTLLQKETGWKPEFEFRSILPNVVNWYLNNLK